jgi:hypothetical protein
LTGISGDLQNDLSPVIGVERFSSVEQALKIGVFHDLLMLDGAPRSRIHTLRMAQASDVIAIPIPSGLSIGDLKPQVLLDRKGQ